MHRLRVFARCEHRANDSRWTVLVSFRLVDLIHMQDMKKHMFSFPGVFFFLFFFLCLFARISHPHCFLLLLLQLSYPISRQHFRICLSLYSAGQNGRWLVEGLFCLPSHLSSFCLFCLSHLICLSPFPDSPSREYPLQLMRDLLSSRYHGMAFREHGGDLALVFVLFYFFALGRI